MDKSTGLHTYAALFRIAAEVSLVFRVPTALVRGCGFEGWVHVRNRQEGTLCFEQLEVPEYY
jgi:hypothetical protein